MAIDDEARVLTCTGRFADVGGTTLIHTIRFVGTSGAATD
jgi:hypothetical protein